MIHAIKHHKDPNSNLNYHRKIGPLGPKNFLDSHLLFFLVCLIWVSDNLVVLLAHMETFAEISKLPIRTRMNYL